jgi:predicted esterase
MTTLLDLRSDDLGGADGATSHAVALLLHGFGSNERDLADVREFLGAHLRPIAA